MRYNRKSMGMLNRDMLKRDMFLFLGATVLFDIVSIISKSRTSLYIALALTAAAVLALILFFVITRPKQLIPDALIDAAEEFEYIIPEDATKRMIPDYAPGLERGSVLVCRKEDEGFGAVCEALRSIKGAHTTIEPDYPRFNMVIHTADSSEIVGTFYENITFDEKIYRVPEKDLERDLFNPSFAGLFHEKY